jgi:hypothetical protein
VIVDAKTWRKTEIPDWVRAGLERFAAASGEAARSGETAERP